MNVKVVVAGLVCALCVGVGGLTYAVSGNPLYAAAMGGLVLLFGLLAVRAVGA